MCDCVYVGVCNGVVVGLCVWSGRERDGGRKKEREGGEEKGVPYQH